MNFLSIYLIVGSVILGLMALLWLISLLQVRGGKETVLAERPGGLLAGQWYRLALRLRHPEGRPVRRVLVNGREGAQYDAAKQVVYLAPAAAPVRVRVEY